MSRSSRPSSPPQHPHSPRRRSNMTETQHALPPPTFLDRPEYQYATFRPQLPSLQTFNFPHHAHPAGPPPPPPSLPPIGTASTEPGFSLRPQAVPISALLSDLPSERKARTDSVAQVPPPPQPYTFSSPPAIPRSPGHSIKQSRSPNLHAPPPPPPPRSTRPIFHSPFASQDQQVATTYTQPYRSHHRRQSSNCSPTSTSPPHHAFPPTGPTTAVAEGLIAINAFPVPSEDEKPNLEYSLKMRQQPIAARACGFGERDRRVIDPPPIIELIAHDPTTGVKYFESDSYTTLHCVLINATTGQDESQIPASRPDQASAQRLMGNAVASPCVANDENGEKGSFFVFPDLSCRSAGRYKLLFRLLKIVPAEMHKNRLNPIRAQIESGAFEVFTAKEFPGMRASSALLRALRAQGLNVGVKKGSEASRRNARRLNRRRRGAGDEFEEDIEEEDREGEVSGGDDEEGRASSAGEEDNNMNEKKHYGTPMGEGKKKSRAKYSDGSGDGEEGPSGKSSKRIRSK